MERQQVAARAEFTYDEKKKIAARSGDRCCHCGKLCYFGYGATVDHFIPIHMGGTNAPENLVMLCEKCNKEKGSLIMDPRTYLPYIGDDAREEVVEYFKDYVQAFDFVKRQNILACDVYEVDVELPLKMFRHEARKRGKGRGKSGGKWRDGAYSQPPTARHEVRRGTLDDLPKLRAYFIRYLSKYGALDDEMAAEHNILFWLKFGCIYYQEQGGEIKAMLACTIQSCQRDGEKPPEQALCMWVFPYYSTDYSLTISNGLVENFPRSIMKEQGLVQLPVRVNMLTDDKLMPCLLGEKDQREEGSRYSTIFYIYTSMKEAQAECLPDTSEDEGLQRFFGRFSDVRRKVDAWIGKNGMEDIAWMRDELYVGREEKADGPRTGKCPSDDRSMLQTRQKR